MHDTSKIGLHNVVGISFVNMKHGAAVLSTLPIKGSQRAKCITIANHMFTESLVEALEEKDEANLRCCPDGRAWSSPKVQHAFRPKICEPHVKLIQDAPDHSVASRQP